MTEFFDVNELRRLFSQRISLMETLRARKNETGNSQTTISYSYDIQAGSYTEIAASPEYREVLFHSAGLLGQIISSLKPTSVLDAGTGEATTLSAVLREMKTLPDVILAFDISLSRLLFARRNIRNIQQADVCLFTGELSNIPVADSSVDLVTTFHAIEPNAGRERKILKELLRVSRRYLVLVEPSFELGSLKTKARITRHSYVRGLVEILSDLGAEIVRHELWPFNVNSRNEAALIVAEKPFHATSLDLCSFSFRSPIGGNPLVKRNGYYYCPQEGFVFPIIEGIPCLLEMNAILATQLNQFEDFELYEI
jgi:ubiquinone/menaquinone biosynthesis C-methylase UbiE